jgi:hypothetical protein
MAADLLDDLFTPPPSPWKLLRSSSNCKLS